MCQLTLHGNSRPPILVATVHTVPSSSPATHSLAAHKGTFLRSLSNGGAHGKAHGPWTKPWTVAHGTWHDVSLSPNHRHPPLRRRFLSPFPPDPQVESTASHDHLNVSIRPEFRAEEAAVEHWYRAYWKAKRLRARVGTRRAQSRSYLAVWLFSTVLVLYQTACTCGLEDADARRVAEKRASAAAPRPRGPMSLSCGHAVAASDVRPLACVCQSACRAEQASKPSPPVKSCSTPTLHHQSPHHPHRASYSCAYLHVRHARSSLITTLGAPPSLDRHLLPYGRMITSMHNQPSCSNRSSPSLIRYLSALELYSLPSSVRDISDAPSPLGLTHMS